MKVSPNYINRLTNEESDGLADWKVAEIQFGDSNRSAASEAKEPKSPSRSNSRPSSRNSSRPTTPPNEVEHKSNPGQPIGLTRAASLSKISGKFPSRET